MPKFTKTGLARQYRDEHGMDMPTLKLARIMYKENPLAFKDLEQARQALRSIEGKNGKSNIKITHQVPDRPKNPYKLPDSWGKSKEVFKLPVLCNKVGFIGDTQIPFHDNKAIIAAVDYLKAKEVNTIFCNGDIADFYGISMYQKDPRKRKFTEEIEDVRLFFAWLRAEFPLATIYFNMNANHELRWEKWLMMKAQEVFGMPEFELDVILKLNDHKIIPLKNYDHCLIGKLPVFHGHTLFGRFGNQVSKAKTVFDKLKHGAIASHVHVTDEYNTKDHVSGKMFTCWTVGCLMDLNIEYNPHGNQYNHGFAYIETDNQGNYKVENKRIFNGKVL